MLFVLAEISMSEGMQEWFSPVLISRAPKLNLLVPLTHTCCVEVALGSVRLVIRGVMNLVLGIGPCRKADVDTRNHSKRLRLPGVTIAL